MKASASEGSWKDSCSPFGVLRQMVAGNANVNLICCLKSSEQICWNAFRFLRPRLNDQISGNISEISKYQDPNSVNLEGAGLPECL